MIDEIATRISKSKSVNANRSSFQKEMLTIIFEPGYSGHRAEYIVHLLKFINSRQHLHNKYILLLDNKSIETLGTLAHSPAYSIKFMDFHSRQYQNNITRSFGEWKMISDFIISVGNIDEIIFMELDPYLFLISSRKFRKLNLKVRGILFQPYVHFRTKTKSFYALTQKTKNYIFQKAVSMMNRNITKVCILNDKIAVAEMNQVIKRIFNYLPDPLPEKNINTDYRTITDVKEKYGIAGDRKTILLFGMIDERKNLLNIIEAFRNLPTETVKAIQLVIAGRFDPVVKAKYITALKKNPPTFSLSIFDGFITDGERDTLFTLSDIILMPYINFFSSSGVIGHAINFKKKVIVSNEGLTDRIVREYKAGISVNPRVPNEIRDAIVQLTGNQNSNYPDVSHFITDHTPEAFAECLLS